MLFRHPDWNFKIRFLFRHNNAEMQAAEFVNCKLK